jgi:hypothetical protein
MTTPKELLELSDTMRRRVFAREGLYDQAASALRSYAELVAALEWLDMKGGCLDAEEIVAAAKKRGWPGLEET